MSGWDRCLSSSDYWDHPDPPLRFPEHELLLSGCSAWAGKRLSRVPGFPLPLQSSPSACYWPSCRREREKHCSQHFSEGETTERSLEGKLPMMRLGLLWECCVSAWSCHQFSQISFWKGHKCSEGLKFEDWDTAKLWVQVVSQNDLTQTTQSLWGE